MYNNIKKYLLKILTIGNFFRDFNMITMLIVWGLYLLMFRDTLYNHSIYNHNDFFILINISSIVAASITAIHYKNNNHIGEPPDTVLFKKLSLGTPFKILFASFRIIIAACYILFVYCGDQGLRILIMMTISIFERLSYNIWTEFQYRVYTDLTDKEEK